MGVLERIRAVEQNSNGAQGMASPAPSMGFEISRVHEFLQERESATREIKKAKRELLRKKTVEKLGLALTSELLETKDKERASLELSAAAHDVLLGNDFDEFSDAEKEELSQEVMHDITGLGVLQPFMDDSSITEVMVNGPDSVFYEREGKLYQSKKVFDSADQIMLVIDRILAPLGRRIDESSPIVNARLANGDRVNAVIAPIALDGPSLTIRRFTGRITSLNRLVELRSLPPWYAQLLRWSVCLRKDIAVAGGTGSGKTTLLNALSLEIPKTERIITIEDSAELSFETHPHVVRLEARSASIEGKGRVSIRDLVTNALRMRPDRIVVGEVRGEEAIDMLQAMNTGHDGSLTTLHAGSAEEAISRLVLMARFSMDLPAQLIEEQVATALDLVVMGKRYSDGARLITSMHAVGRKKNGAVGLSPIVSYEEATRTWHLEKIPQFLQDAVAEKILTQKEVDAWYSTSAS